MQWIYSWLHAEYNYNRKYILQCNEYIHGFRLNSVIYIYCYIMISIKRTAYIAGNILPMVKYK